MTAARFAAMVAVLLAVSAEPIGAVGRGSPPEGLDVRIVGTASFRGRQTALIEDRNAQSDAFYRVGDLVYGYRITAIGTDGVELMKGDQKYFLPFEASPAKPAVASAPPAPPSPDSSNALVTPNTYISTSPGPVAFNFYTEVPKTTQWDLYTERQTRRAAGRREERPIPAPATAIAAAGAGGRFVFPLASFKRLSSGFGYRKHPLGGGTKMHKGIDLSARTGTKIFAADSGRVTFSGWKGGYGYCVIIDHHNGYQTLYGHCSKLLVDVGDNVRRGEYIAAVGSTGASTGPHLHFEVHRNGTPVNPVQYFKDRL
ncbi:MAG: M23 family metallopeptidase [Candidatus Sumerlaeaceae bacterium]|nr:M23 family metallopeptidase [Candidatus Sumerlaeaceae bacterium]